MLTNFRRIPFRLFRKPQANVSPIRHLQSPQQQQLIQQQLNNNYTNNKYTQQTATNSRRQRSNTVSKIPTLITKHNSPQQSYYASAHQRSTSCANAINNNQYNSRLYEPQNSNCNSNTNSNSNIYHHLQPHIPIYHQQMAINPAVIAAQNALLTASNNGWAAAMGHHGKMNLCGYDSFLHATICGGGLNHSPPPPHQTALNTQVTGTTAAGRGYQVRQQQHQQQQQKIATVQPIMSTNVRQNTSAKHLSFALSANHIKTSKILHSGSYAQTQHQHQHQSQVHTLNNTNQNSPQYHGYQRLPSVSKHNLSVLHLVSPTMKKPPLDQLNNWRRDQVKKYDQLLYAKLSEKLQLTNLMSSSSTAVHNVRRKHRVLRQRRTNNLIAEANNISLLSSQLMANKVCLKDDSDYATTLPLGGDPVEYEKLLGQTTDEESHSQHNSPLQNEEKSNVSTSLKRHVTEGTLVDLEDDNELAQTPDSNKHSLNGDGLLGGVEAELEELHLNDGLEVEADIDDELTEPDIEMVRESGRNSAASNDSNNAGATLANTSGGTNTSNTSSSLIHRYVHEHIHHHYHHFEEKKE